MQICTFVFLAAVVALALAEGQFYVPRAYYIIDSEGHESPPVPLRRLRRSTGPLIAYPSYPGSASNANAQATATAVAQAQGSAGGWGNSGGWGKPSGWGNQGGSTWGGNSELSRPDPWNLPGWGSNNGGAANPAYKH